MGDRPVSNKLRLGITTDGHGLPLSMASGLLGAIGRLYPGTVMAETRGTESMAVTIQEADYLDPGDNTGEPIVAVKDDPQMLAFLTGLRDGSVQIGPPPWLSAMLLEATEGILSTTDAPNYLEMKLRSTSAAAEWFSWIVCRPGTPSPHELRRLAEARVAALEQQLRAAGIEPDIGPRDWDAGQ